MGWGDAGEYDGAAEVAFLHRTGPGAQWSVPGLCVYGVVDAMSVAVGTHLFFG